MLNPFYTIKKRFGSRLCLSALAMLLTGAVYGQSSVQAESLFDGESLSEWRVLGMEEANIWSAHNGVIRGGDGETLITENSYLYREIPYEDFELRCLFRLSGDPSTGMINSGIQYRSQIEGELMIGYQADMGEGYWGDIYDEHRRGELVAGDLSTLKDILRPQGWNSYIIRVKGDHHELYINGVKTADYIEEDKSIPKKGIIGVQVHSGGEAQVEFKDITINAL